MSERPDERPRPRPRRRPRVDRGPRPIGDSLDDALLVLGPPSGSREPGAGRTRGGVSASVATWNVVFSRWEEVVGPAMSRHVRPLRLDASALVVAADRPPWATQVRALAPGILQRVSELAGEKPARLDVVIKPRSES